jgi:hypothetical protein
LRLLDAKFEKEAYLLILATWNFAGLRYVMKSFDLNDFEDAILETEPYFARLAGISFQKACFDSIREEVEAIYDRFQPSARQTGVSKIMHFKNPNLFVMWDTAIRKHYGFRYRTTARNYLEFQKEMQNRFGHLKWTCRDKTLPKAIDEYNFLTVPR